ncbi:MAG: universal stress protein, partial [Desulfovibrio sp.]|nr:universal stress protein [Desulfovibrio sp.]
MYSKILLPVSGESRGERSRKALAKAMSVSSGEIVLLHVTEPISQVVGGEARTELEREEAAQGLTLL